MGQVVTYLSEIRAIVRAHAVAYGSSFLCSPGREAGCVLHHLNQCHPTRDGNVRILGVECRHEHYAESVMSVARAVRGYETQSSAHIAHFGVLEKQFEHITGADIATYCPRPDMVYMDTDLPGIDTFRWVARAWRCGWFADNTTFSWTIQRSAPGGGTPELRELKKACHAWYDSLPFIDRSRFDGKTGRLFLDAYDEHPTNIARVLPNVDNKGPKAVAEPLEKLTDYQGFMTGLFRLLFRGQVQIDKSLVYPHADDANSRANMWMIRFQADKRLPKDPLAEKFLHQVL